MTASRALVGSISVTMTSAPSAAGAAGEAAAAPAVAGDHELRSGQQEVGGADDAVDGGLSGAVAVVEQVLGVGVVDGDDRDTCSTPSFAIARRRMTPVVVSSVPPMTPSSASVRLVCENGDQVGAVVHGDVRLVVDGGQDVLVVGVVVLALDGEDGDVVVAHQAGGDVVLRGKRVGGAKHDVGAAIAQADRQVRGLGGDVQAGGDADAFQRLVLDEFLADDLQNLHRLVRPLDALLAQIGQFDVFTSHAIASAVVAMLLLLMR